MKTHLQTIQKTLRLASSSLLLTGSLAISPFQPASAQIKIDSLTAISTNATPSSVSNVTGAIGGTGYSATTNYTLNYGTSTATNKDLVLTGATVSGKSYAIQQLADYIGIQRNSLTERHIVQFERVSNVNTTINLAPTAVTSMEDALLGNIINRGADNVFVNQGDGAGNNNNIERIDLITTSGLTAPSSAAKLNQVGFLILDRGTGDSFKIAAITGLDPVTKKPTSLGTLVSVASSNTFWGPSGYTMPTTVTRRDGVGALQPSIDVSSQNISGVFISYQTLGITSGQKIYGYTLFPADANPSTLNLLTLSGAITNTPSNGGGLDLLAGGLSFSEYPTTDLSITKTDGQTTIPAGSPITYTISVINNGSTALTSLKVTDTLPAALYNPTFTPSVGTYNAVTGDWTGLTLNPKQTIQLTVTGTIAHNFSGILTNTAIISPPAGTEDFNPDNNTATDTTTVVDATDVLGRKSVRFVTDQDSNGVVSLNDEVEYTITYSNLSPTAKTDAINFLINDTLPSQLSYIPGSATITQTSGNNITLNPTYNGSGALTTLVNGTNSSNSSTLRVGDTITIKLKARVIDSNGGASISNQAIAQFNTPANPTTQTILTDADSAGATATTPPVGDPFAQSTDDGTNTGNNPGSNADDDPTLFSVSTTSPPRLRLVKRLTAIESTLFADYIDVVDGTSAASDNAPNWFNSTVTATKSDGTGTTPNFSDYLKGIVDGAALPPNQRPQPTNEVEYTIYFLSDGGKSAGNVSLCDFVPANTTAVPNSIQLVMGAGAPVLVTDATTTDSDGGFYDSSTTTFPAACTGGTNNNRGAIVVNVGNVINATSPGTTGSYGYIRFRAKVN